MKLIREEAWEKIHRYNIFNKEDVFQDALLNLYIRVRKNGIENFPSMVRSVVIDSFKKARNCD